VSLLGVLVTADTYNYCTVMAHGGHATFQAIAGAIGDTFRLKLSVNSDLSAPFYSDESTAAAAIGDPVSVTVRNLTKGQKYYYKAQVDDGGWADIADAETQYFKNGAMENEKIIIAIPSDTHLNGYKKPTQAATRNCWYANNTNDDAAARKAKLTSFAPFSHYLAGRDGSTITGEGFLDPSHNNCLGHGIKTHEPDFVHWGGDDCFVKDDINKTWTDDTSISAAYQNFARAVAFFNASQTFAEGNHEEDSLTTEGTQAEVLAAREKYLLDPETGLKGRYGYVDIGAIRLIYLTPYPFTPKYNTGDPLPAVMFTLGATQAAWFAGAVKGRQKFNLIFIHQMLTSSSIDDYFNVFGTATVDGVDYTKLYNNPAEMFNAIERCGRECVVVLGHIHNYARERTESGLYVFSCPAPYNGREDSVEGNPSFYPMGIAEEAPHYGGDDPILMGTLFFEIDQEMMTLKSYVVKNTGDIATEIPTSTIKLRGGGRMG